MRCYCSSPSSRSCDATTHTKTCEPGVTHCLLSLRWHNESNRHIEHIQDCWLWSSDMSGCPDTNGPCYLISKANNKFTTCCCKGDLCNNATNIEVVAPTVNIGNRSFVSSRIPQIKVPTIEQDANVHPSDDLYEEKYLVLLITAPVITILLLVFLLVLLRFCFSRSGKFKFKQHEKSRICGHRCGTVGFLAIPRNGLSTCTCSQPLKDETLDKTTMRNEFYDLNSISKQPITGLCWIPDSEYNELASVIKKVELKAHGRFGKVWHGKFTPPTTTESANVSQKQDTDVAIKIFSAEEKRSWETEVSLFHVPGLNHANVLKYYGADKVVLENSTVGNCAYEYWLITEYHELGSLYDYLHNHVVSWLELLAIAIGIARGLAHLHSEIPSMDKPSIAHRDLNSRNVLLKSDLTACIADFGLAIRFESGQCMRDAHLQLGTRRYMAPEVLDGAIQFSRDAYLRIDVYAMGLVFWELMMRCSGSSADNPIPSTKYWAPFELELGLQPSMETLQRLVAHSKQRPKFNALWQSDMGLHALWETVEECWDQDAEARLSAGCVAERLTTLYRYFNSANMSTRDSNNNDNEDLTTHVTGDLSMKHKTEMFSHDDVVMSCSKSVGLNDEQQFCKRVNANHSTVCGPKPPLCTTREFMLNCNGLSSNFANYCTDFQKDITNLTTTENNNKSNRNKKNMNNNNIITVGANNQGVLYNPELQKLLDHQSC